MHLTSKSFFLHRWNDQLNKSQCVQKCNVRTMPRKEAVLSNAEFEAAHFFWKCQKILTLWRCSIWFFDFKPIRACFLMWFVRRGRVQKSSTCHITQVLRGWCCDGWCCLWFGDWSNNPQMSIVTCVFCVDVDFLFLVWFYMVHEEEKKRINFVVSCHQS